VITVLPRIATDLHVSIGELDQAAWIVTAYLLGYTAAMPLLGRAADVYGDREVFTACAALFAAGSWWAAVAPDLWQLVGARGLQAVGGGGMVPVALAASAVVVDRRRRLLALGLVTGAAETGAVLGPLYGALVVRELGWRWVFWINLPVMALLVGGLARTREGTARRATGRVSYSGALAAGLALAALTVGLQGRGVGLGHGFRIVAFLLAAAFALAFAVQQRRTPSPLVPRELFGQSPFRAANAANLCIGAALVVALVEVPLFANVVLHESATTGGLTLLRLTALIPIGAIAGGRLAARVPARTVGVVGMLVSASGFVFLSRWDAGIAEPKLSLDLALVGFGFGLVLAPLSGAVLWAARGGNEAVGAAALTTARMVGMMAGLSALTAWGIAEFDRRASRYLLPLPQPSQSEHEYHVLLDRYEDHIAAAALYVFDRLFLVAAGLCALSAVAGLWLRSGPKHRAPVAQRAK
jgi:hypothetical protein